MVSRSPSGTGAAIGRLACPRAGASTRLAPPAPGQSALRLSRLGVRAQRAGSFRSPSRCSASRPPRLSDRDLSTAPRAMATHGSAWRNRLPTFPSARSSGQRDGERFSSSMKPGPPARYGHWRTASTTRISASCTGRRSGSSPNPSRAATN
jgi:hypothetical protein